MTVWDDVPLQPSAVVTVTEYTPLMLKVFAAVFVLLPPLHAYVLPPDAVRETLPQPVGLPLILMLGKGLTVTVWLVVTWHPPAS